MPIKKLFSVTKNSSDDFDKKYFSKMKEYFIKFQKDSLSPKELVEGEEKSVHLGEQIENFKLLLSMARDYFSGRFPDIDKSILIQLIAVIIYVVSPIDAIPDYIPFLGYLDDIAIVAWFFKNQKTLVLSYKTMKMSIEKVIDKNIEYRVGSWIDSMKLKIRARFQSLGFQILLELVFFASMIGALYYNPQFPALKITYGYIVGRLLWAIIHSGVKNFKFLNEIEFFTVSKFFYYLRETKNIKDSFKKNALNFYEYNYQKHLSASAQIAHKAGSVLTLTPSSLEIFEKIYKSVYKNMKIFLFKEVQVLVVFICLYYIAVQVIRYYSFKLMG